MPTPVTDAFDHPASRSCESERGHHVPTSRSFRSARSVAGLRRKRGIGVAMAVAVTVTLAVQAPGIAEAAPQWTPRTPTEAAGVPA